MREPTLVTLSLARPVNTPLTPENVRTGLLRPGKVEYDNGKTETVN